ncbi:MAG: hypothetical protein NC412_10930 [Roseburia sp.]|nr:hypothetical protein [Roseburia sp.]MCM1279335.1 hypothetical protein [Robinsoniella sp.]
MKGCIIKNNGLTIKDVYNCVEDVDKYNWLITNIECYPNNMKIKRLLSNEYCWIAGKDLLKILYTEDFQWVWGVFSAFSKEVKLNEVLNYSFPYADGYKGFWKNPISIQHPLAKMEIVAWDGLIILAISKEKKDIEAIMKNKAEAEDLEDYNKEQS